MRSLQSHHITDLYVLVDDHLLPASPVKIGRPSLLSNTEVVTILLWSVLTEKHHTLRDIYGWIQRIHQSEFPQLPNYQNFVAHCHRLAPVLVQILQSLLAASSELRFLDSTMLPVCREVRSRYHRVARGVATYGYNHQGRHFGFKLHLAVNAKGQLCALRLTPGSEHDAQIMPFLVNSHTKIAVGDAGYTASVMREKIWRAFGTLIISPPHYKQTKKLMAKWQHVLLKMRPKIEAVFGYLKQRLGLVTSFPRSVKGYLLHYVRVLIGYQLMVG